MADFDLSSLQALTQQFQPTEDDKRQARLMALAQASAGLLGAPKGHVAQALGRSIQGGLLGYQTDLRDQSNQKLLNMRGASEAMNVLNQQNALKDTDAMRAAANRYFTPGRPEMGPPTADGQMVPAVPPKEDWQGYQAALARIGPQGVAMSAQIDPWVRRQAMRDAQASVTGGPQMNPGQGPQQGPPQGMPPPPQQGLPQVPQGMPQGAQQPQQPPQQGVGKGNATQQFIAEQMQLIRAYRAKGLDQEANDLQQKLIGMLPQSKPENVVTRNPDGSVGYTSIDSQGGVNNLGIVPGDALHFQSVGNAVLGLDKYTGKQAGPAYKMGQSPDSVASNAVSMRGQNMTDARARENIAISRVEKDPLGMLGLNPNGMAAGGGQNATPLQSAVANGLHGEELIKSLPEPVGNYIRGMINGKQPYPGAFALKDPRIQQYIMLASQADPSFDATSWQTRTATRQDFAKGKAAQNVTALNTAADHLTRLNDSLSNLNNFGGIGTPLNAPINAVAGAFGSPRQKAADMDVTAVSHELAKVFRQVGMSDKEVATWEANISKNMSPDAKNAAISEGVHLIDGRIQALANQYNTGMGSNVSGYDLLSPQAKAAYDKLRNLYSPDGAGKGGSSGWTVTERK